MSRTHPRDVHRRRHRLLDIFRGVIGGLLSPALAVLGRGVGRRRTRRRLAAGSHVGDTPMRAAGSASPSDPVASASRARSRTRIAAPRARSRAPIAAQRDPEFSVVRVLPDFSPRDYADTFAALQLSAPGKVLDLVPARLLCADVFERMAASWTASPDAMPRLGILLSFERWVMLREAALASLQPLTARGVQLEIFYAEQASAGGVADWFAHDLFVHNVRAAIATLTARWHPCANWPLVISTLGRLARSCTPADELPGLLTQIAALALSCGGAVEAASLASEALFYLPKSASATRGQALRELGTALICQEQTAAGLAFLDQAFAVAAEAEAPDIGASALCHSGLCALNHGDYPAAARRFRRAIELLSPPVRRPHLVALAHHNLAVALMHQGERDAAEYHVRTALALRPDPESHLAEEDRILLAKLCALRGDRPAPQARSAGAKLVPITSGSRPTHPRASEVEM